MRNRIIRAWLALCRDKRQCGHGLATIKTSRQDFLKHFATYRFKIDDRLVIDVGCDEAIEKGKFRISAGSLYMIIPFEPNNIQRLAEMTGNWPIFGWWKQKDPWKLMMKHR